MLGIVDSKSSSETDEYDKRTSTRNLLQASRSALQQDAGTGDDGNSRMTYWKNPLKYKRYCFQDITKFMQKFVSSVTEDTFTQSAITCGSSSGENSVFPELENIGKELLEHFRLTLKRVLLYCKNHEISATKIEKKECLINSLLKPSFQRCTTIL